ncbi:transporter substrate-binding domain-containing protein [Terasakiella sp. A23]|uniref:substrate-binding periplasmic protein n=1 Tax=Terasakiella sp. FCG-A23 TaxID=3080561 RepID=UPI002955ADA8|nr:transporter substrate-binding domain-containing protein [Terasakiella sp. A23]MDV7341608.1 transporter substrate-binding domain-containing protein [Terasakiella sp. A23]
MKWPFVISLILTVCFILPAHSANISIALPHLPPLISIDENKQPHGVFVDHLNVLFSKNNISPTYIVVPWRRAMHSVESGKADLTLLATNIGWVQDHFLITDSLMSRKIVLVTQKSISQGTIKSVDDSSQLSVATVSGDSLEVELSGRGIPHKTFPTIKNGLKMLVSDRFDAILTYQSTAQHQAELLDLKDHINFHFVQKQPIYIGLSKRNPVLKKLVPLLNKTIQEIKKASTSSIN